jgi:glucokinase
MHLLVADIGGTNSRCAVSTGFAAPERIGRFRNADFPDLAALLSAYLAGLPATARPRVAALAVAAPIGGDEVRMMNITWRFSRRELQQRLALDQIHVVNDFAALAWALPALGAAELRQVGSGSAVPQAPKLVLGPGTGLGVATLAPCGDGWQAIPGEGGHVTLAACDAADEKIIRAARERFGHCSAERLLSGAGLGFLQQALHGGEAMPAEVIGAALAAGDAAAAATFEAFFRLLGTVAGNAALTVGASGGVYVGGGIVPRYAEAFARSGFRERFEAKGRYRDYMRAIPTWLIGARDPALTGLVALARSRSRAVKP